MLAFITHGDDLPWLQNHSQDQAAGPKTNYPGWYNYIVINIQLYIQLSILMSTDISHTMGLLFRIGFNQMINHTLGIYWLERTNTITLGGGSEWAVAPWGLITAQLSTPSIWGWAVLFWFILSLCVLLHPDIAIVYAWKIVCLIFKPLGWHGQTTW